jgi:nucleoside 2-deoxyribosyltransferase
MKSVYMAGSVHHADDGGHGWRDAVERQHPNLVWVNPLDKYDGHANDVVIQRAHGPRGVAVGPGVELVSSAEIVESDKEMVEQADAVLVGWSPSIPACGTPMEVLFAWENDVPVVAWIREDVGFESVSPWLDYHSDYMTKEVDDAVEYIENNV